MFEDRDPLLYPTASSSPLSSATNSPRKQNNTSKEYDIEIQGDEQGPFDPTQKTVVCLSLRQPYGQGRIFNALFRELYKQWKEKGAFFYLIIPHTLERFNYQVEENLNAEESLRQTLHLKRDWVSQNLEADPEICEMRKEMEAAGGLIILDWDQCQKTFSAGLSYARERIAQLTQADNHKYHKQTTDLAASFYQKACEKHSATNIHFQAACAKSEKDVLHLYWSYADEESRMAGAWIFDGITQILYPTNFYELIHGKKSNNPACDLFSCVKETFAQNTNPRMLNIQVTPRDPAFLPKSQRRKSSIDTEVAQKVAFIDKLKAEKRLLSAQQGQNKVKLKTFEKSLQEAREQLKEKELASNENQEKARALENEMARCVAEIQTLRRMIQTQDKGVDDYSNRIWLLENENKFLTAEVLSMQGAHEEAKAIINELKTQYEALKQSAQEEREARYWCHSSDLEALYSSLRDQRNKAEKAEREARHSGSFSQAVVQDLCEMRQENRTLKKKLAGMEARERVLEEREREVEQKTRELQAKEKALNDKAGLLELRRTNLNMRAMTAEITEERRLRQEESHKTDETRRNSSRSGNATPNTSSRSSSAATSASSIDHPHRSRIQETLMNIVHRISPSSKWGSSKEGEISRPNTASPSPQEKTSSPPLSPMPKIRPLTVLHNIIPQKVAVAPEAEAPLEYSLKKSHLSAPELGRGVVKRV